ncbi:MAG: Laminin G sub domain 2, partial [candidate division WS6 bacterium GW2011_GWC1_36_11]
ATSSDGLTWTKYDNSIPTASNTTGTNGRIPPGTSGGDAAGTWVPSVIKDGSTYKMWYTGIQTVGGDQGLYATSSDGLTWTKYDNTTATASDTTSTNGRIAVGTSGSGDELGIGIGTVLKDGSTYKAWYSGSDSSWNSALYYATSSDGLTWTKYDNSILANSDSICTNGRIPGGTTGRGDDTGVFPGYIIKDGDTYKSWYSGGMGGSGGYYATGVETIGSWEEWKPYALGTNYTILESADTHTDWTGTNATVAEGDITRDVDYFEDEDEPLGTNITKVTSSTNGGYMESTISATNIVNYDYLTLWVRASQAGNVLRIGIGESAATEQFEDITIDVANVWQKVYWDLSDIAATDRDQITKIRLTNFSTSSNDIYLDNVRAEKLLSVNTGSPIASTPNQYFQYRVIFTTTDLSYQPQLESISLAYNSGYRIVLYDENNVQLYNYSGGTQYLRLEVVASTGAGSSGSGFVNGLAVSHVEDGTDAIAFQFNTAMAFTNPSSKLLSVMNNSVEKMYLDADGNLYVSGTITSGKGLGAVLTNNSGSIVNERSLVTVDSSTNGAFTTTTVAGLQGALGVVQGVELNGDVDKDGVCDNGDACLVAFEGVVDVMLDNAASSSRGDYIYSSTVAGKGHSASGTTQTNGLLGVVTSITDAGSGYVKMVFDAQNKVTADMYLNVSYDENLYRDMYNQLANDYTAMSDAERRGYLESNQSQTIMFDNFVDSLKIDSTNSTIGVDADAKKAGLWGGVTIDNSMLDIAGNRYLGSATATLLTSKYYDRTQSGLQGQDSTPETLVDVGVDPNWYKGVSLQTASNLTTSYNGSLISVSGVYGTGSEHGYIDLTITGTTTTGITANIVSSDGTCSASGANLAFGSSYAFVSGSCSGSSITIKPVRSDYKNGDIFRIASWYVEPETADDRGVKKEFPERAVILASSDASNGYLSIIDVDTQRVWMKFVQSSTGEMLGVALNNTISSISMNNGTMNVGMNGSAATGMYSVQFSDSLAYKYNTSGKSISNKSISDRNIANTYSVVNASQVLVNNIVNDVSSAVIPNQPTQEMTVSGWGYIQGSVANVISESVSLPYKFDNTPIVQVNSANFKSTSAPANLSECVSQYNQLVADPLGITDSSFTAKIHKDDGGNFATTQYVCYTWTATGQVSPNQFVAAATNAGTTLVNRTAQSVATTGNPSYSDGKVFLTSNNSLYIGYTSYGQIRAHNGVAGAPNGFKENYLYYGGSTPSLISSNVGGAVKSLYVSEGTSTVDGKSNTIYVSTTGVNDGLTILQEKQSGGSCNTSSCDGTDEKNGSVKYYTKDYISEQMVGDIRGMWPLNYDNTSADNEDISVKANALTAVNIDSNDAVSGVRGKAVDFNGTDEYLYCTEANCGGTTKLDFPGTGSWGVGAWIKTSQTTQGAIISKDISGSRAYEMTINESSGKARFYAFGSSGYSYSTSKTSINDNQWHYIVGTYTYVGDGTSNIAIYIDGVLEESSSTAYGPINDSTSNVNIGARYYTSWDMYFAGTIDEPFVTATALTFVQIKSQYEDGLRALKGSHTVDDTYNQLSGTSNDVRDILVTPDSKYMYVGTEGGGISKIDLTSSTRLNAYTIATDPSTSTNNIETLSGRYYPVFAGDIGSSGSLMGIDSNGNNSTGTYYSNVTTFAESTNRAFLWMTASIDGSDPSSSITVSASNDNGANYVTGTLIQTNTSGSLPEYEYSFVFPTSDKNYKVKFEIARGSSNKATTYITKWGLS